MWIRNVYALRCTEDAMYSLNALHTVQWRRHTSSTVQRTKYDENTYVYLDAYVCTVCNVFIHDGRRHTSSTDDDLSCKAFFAKEPLITGLFCGKWCNLVHMMIFASLLCAHINKDDDDMWLMHACSVFMCAMYSCVKRICVCSVQHGADPPGCLKLQGIFRKRATNYRALLRKMTYEDDSSYGSSPLCMHVCNIFMCANHLFTWMV